MIVVGIDGSAGAKAALRFAADEASLRQTQLRVV
jgi:nucleotide-binding universal stress UspA family protein